MKRTNPAAPGPMMNRNLSPCDADLFVWNPLTKGHREQYEAEGYLYLGRTLTDRGLEQLRQQCMEAWDAEKRRFDPRLSWRYNVLLRGTTRFPEVQAFDNDLD